MRRFLNIYLPLILIITVPLLFAWASVEGAASGVVAWSHDIHYYNQTEDGFAVKDAAQTWNQAGLPIKFIAVSDPDEADLLIKQMPLEALRHAYCSQDCIGLSNSIGYDTDEKNVVYLGETVNTIELNRLVLHEFGHVLGLTHTHQHCSIMTPSYTCSAAQQGLVQPRCLLTSDNIDQLALLYHVSASVIHCPTMSKQGLLAFDLAKLRNQQPQALLGSLPVLPQRSSEARTIGHLQLVAKNFRIFSHRGGF